ncbi:hypothetical protein HMPREF0063_10203 [Aeromicrobium marinum DSM 15272]|uniref:Uncharacterized protein n=1 Tax=Aeromicrobium marinum DSM 15272 TaxID=585531 RepID=E2S846_9ACTN|nr:hypothetical protein [Aeromicrobium marinum]EFQ84351.1 hypothetical protein HMPREF0063_10203 [Aeromicrobium marinum DSM 15272]
MSQRQTITVASPSGGWGEPWPNVAEIAEVLEPTSWSLVGGLMVQLHAIHTGIDAIRPTTDIDMLVHVETGRGRPAAIARALASLGYELAPPIDPRNPAAHRFHRTAVPAGPPRGTEQVDVVDLVVADHAAPAAREKLLGYQMVGIAGGTQALRRTVNANLTIDPHRPVVVSVPGVFGALILKAAAHLADSRNPERHLQDAAVLLSCLDDPWAELEKPRSGSDGTRLRHLTQHLADPSHPAWLPLTDDQRRDGRAALRVLTGGEPITHES